MASIDVGSGAFDGSVSLVVGSTQLDENNPANATGILTSFEVWFYLASDNVKAGVFFGATTTWENRDYESIGSVSSLSLIHI